MNLEIEPPDGHRLEPLSIEQRDQAGPANESAIRDLAERPLDARRLDSPSPSRERRSYELRGYHYQISAAEVQTMRDVGRFRTINVTDLERYGYRGNGSHMLEDLDSLRAQGLVQVRTVWTGPKDEKQTLVALTKVGKAVLAGQPHEVSSAQEIYAGFVKPAEVAHDAAIYRMYQVEAEKIERAGGRIKRVVLDFELKQKVYRPLAKERALSGKSPSNSREYARLQAEVAHMNQLKVVGGKILLPDLRIEYNTSGGDSTHVDLELATHHYRGRSLAAKAEAGFKLYAPKSSGMAAAYDPEIMAEIYSF